MSAHLHWRPSASLDANMEAITLTFYVSEDLLNEDLISPDVIAQGIMPGVALAIEEHRKSRPTGR